MILMKMPHAAVLGAALLAAAPAAAQPSQPSDGVVFIRVFANVSAELEEIRKRIEQRDLEVTTGSGFIVSPSGYILTNHHLIHLENRTIKIDGREIEIKMTVARIEVVLASGQRFDASVFGSDPEMDLAVLAVGGGGLPYVPLGDSDVIERGTSVTALGYPFGRSIEVGRQQTDDVVPQATITPGNVSAIRGGDDDQPRFLQITNALNPGNSGGPIVDDEGYAVGIVVMKATKAASIGFAIAINRAKDFLEKVGLDSALPVRRLGLAAPSSLPDKGLRLQMPHGYQDVLPGRLRVEAGPSEAEVLRIERLASPLAVDDAEKRLMGGILVGDVHAFIMDGSRRRTPARGQVFGRAVRPTLDGRRVVMEYAILSVGATERIVARYVGAADQMAFNAGALRASLRSIEADPLLRGETPPPRWRAGHPLPEGWVREPDESPMCRPVPTLPTVFVVTAPENFMVRARFAVWEGASAPTVIAGCDVPREGSYKRFGNVGGATHVMLGQFLQGEQGVLQIELSAPPEREASLSQWLREWRAALEAK